MVKQGIRPPNAIHSIINEYNDSSVSEMAEEERSERVKPTPKSGLGSLWDVTSHDERPRTASWTNPAVVRVATSERGKRETWERQRSPTTSEEYRRLRAEHERTARRLRELRELDDRQYAEQVEFQNIVAEADHHEAVKVAREQEELLQVSERVEAARRESEERELKARAAEDAARVLRDETEQPKQELAAQIKADELRGHQIMESVHRSPTVRSVTSSDPKRWRLEDLMVFGKSRIPDMGIDWDAEGKPIIVGPAPQRGRSVGTKGGKPLRVPNSKDARKPEKPGHPFHSHTCHSPNHCFVLQNRGEDIYGRRELDRWADPSQIIATGTNYKLVTAFPETPVPFAQYLLRISFTFNSALFARRIS
ncbi:hypothetical protein B0H14DRAFT_2644417 [Mycena olivaceomarginata]|nr:hypothetical protein B0H14DRAFT_2644417 [Mycena olivaceomarginata]